MDTRFDLDQPTSVTEALKCMAADGAMALAGGTNVIVDLRAGRVRPQRLVSLDRLAELRGIREHDGKITIGGRTTVTDLLRSEAIARTAPSLVESGLVFAGQMVRNAATVAGNIACGSPAADLVPPLMSLDAELTLISARGSRSLALADFFTGYRQDGRSPGELIGAISWRPVAGRHSNLFYKLARRKGDAITVAGLAVSLAARDGRCSWVRIALGAVAPVVLRAREAEAMLEGQALTPALIEAASRKAADCCRPIGDIRASAEYRHHAVHVLTRRLLGQAWERLN